ncbi:MaoC/PaaZ C-terminal domain-containing protein [Gracilibacillus sp. YIM 98692]|uniref:MaoC family dehydratase n=1 Tax=Gracilibacillus sp. YIM 98692 TaxID=2663532 RepID=UPI0013D1CDE5|nr:MaoC/PaaZ C-terminal domain-containing protein [Gracilibacillus sp. YIM 98692]
MCVRTRCTVKITEEKVKQYSLLSGDQNPIHQNKKEAKKYRFKRPIAHGMLIMGMGAEICSVLRNKDFFVSDYEMNFQKPVYVDDVIELVVKDPSPSPWVEIRGTVEGKQVVKGNLRFKKI